jgi:hypothetical protein
MPWKSTMDKTEKVLRNASNLLKRKGHRCNRNIQQIIHNQPGDPVAAGDFTIQRAFSYGMFRY